MSSESPLRFSAGSDGFFLGSLLRSFDAAFFFSGWFMNPPWQSSSTAQMRSRRLELAALDSGHQLGEADMARRRHADLGAFARDQAVHLLDLGAASLDHVLRHRRALDVGARVGAGLRDQHALDRGERFGIALAGSRELLRLYAADLLELETERLADAYAFAGELDLEAADRRVVGARRRGKPGGGGDAVAHAVLHQLRP